MTKILRNFQGYMIYFQKPLKKRIKKFAPKRSIYPCSVSFTSINQSTNSDGNGNNFLVWSSQYKTIYTWGFIAMWSMKKSKFWSGTPQVLRKKLLKNF